MNASFIFVKGQKGLAPKKEMSYLVASNTSRRILFILYLLQLLLINNKMEVNTSLCKAVMTHLIKSAHLIRFIFYIIFLEHC